jgi:opacity protein-like surface antigen
MLLGPEAENGLISIREIFAQGGWFMKEKKLICAGAIILVILALTQFAQAQQVGSEENRDGTFILGAGLGLQAGTPDGGAFALGFTGDYYLTQGFSIGPLLQMGFTGDLFQFSLTGQAKYTFDLKEIPALKPHIQAGIGFIYSDLDRGRRGSEDDVSFLIPLGVGAEYRLTNSVSLDSTFLFNFTDLDVRDEHFFFTWLVGLKYRF